MSMFYTECTASGVCVYKRPASCSRSSVSSISRVSRMAHTIRLLACGSRAPQQARRRDRVTPLAPVYRLPSPLPVASPRYHTGAKDTLEVKEAPGAGKVFAIGDCTDVAVPKLGVLAGMEGMSVTK